jgi:hypothetical protein
MGGRSGSPSAKTAISTAASRSASASATSSSRPAADGAATFDYAWAASGFQYCVETANLPLLCIELPPT